MSAGLMTVLGWLLVGLAMVADSLALVLLGLGIVRPSKFSDWQLGAFVILSLSQLAGLIGILLLVANLI